MIEAEWNFDHYWRVDNEDSRLLTFVIELVSIVCRFDEAVTFSAATIMADEQEEVTKTIEPSQTPNTEVNEETSGKSAPTSEKEGGIYDEETGERLCSVNEFLESEEALDEEARLLLGAQDPNTCTFAEGYKPRQALYSCITCTPNGTAGVCYGCLINCHDGHEFVELYTKRRFKCDCGNERFAKKCTLFEGDKPSSNDRNSYNHNFINKYCVCERPYPDPEKECDEDMLQCVVCEDWFHPPHIELDATPKEGEETEMACKDCTAKLPFLHNVALHTSVEDAIKCTVAKPEIEIEPKSIFLSMAWRSRLCDCSKCEDLYDSLGVDWIHDVDDPLAKFTEENMDQCKELTDADVVRELVKEAGPEGSIAILSEVNNMKRKFGDFMKRATETNAVITASDIHGFFSELKRQRLEEREANEKEQ